MAIEKFQIKLRKKCQLLIVIGILDLLINLIIYNLFYTPKTFFGVQD